MPEAQEQSFKPNFTNEINIESIISAPLVAASKANVFMVTGQTRFLLDYCFKKREDGTHEPIMIQMWLHRGELVPGETPSEPSRIKKVELAFNIPLLCLVPLSSLVIDKVTVDFDMEITSATSYETSGEGISNNRIIDKKAQLNGRIASAPKNGKGEVNTKSTSTLKVGINAGPLPLPNGVLAIIDLYTKSIQPLPVKEDTTEIENSQTTETKPEQS